MMRRSSQSFSFLTAEEFQTERDVTQYLDWVENIYLQFQSTKELRNSARLGCGLAKEFFDEVWPLHWFIKSHRTQFKNAKIQHSIGNQSFDACIRRYRNGTQCVEIHVEITAPRDGQEESLRMSYLAEHGRVSAWGPIGRRKNERGEQVIYEMSEARCRDEHITEVYQWAEKGLTEKSRGLITGKYQADMLLIVMIEDIGISRFEDGLPKLPDVIDRVFRGGLRFENIVVIGTAGRVYFERTDGLLVEGANP